MTLAEVKQFLRENAEKDAEVKAYLAELAKVSPDQEEKIIEVYKKSQDFKSEIDRANTKAINTYTEKTVPGLIDKEVKAKEAELEAKYNPPKNPEVLKLTEQMKQLETQALENNKKIIAKEIKNMKQQLLGLKNIPIEYADLISINAEGLTVKDIEDESKLKELITPQVDKLFSLVESAKTLKATEMIKGSGIIPKDGNANTNTGQWTKEDLSKATAEKRYSDINQARKEGKLNNLAAGNSVN